jgi:hypothetical protein
MPIPVAATSHASAVSGRSNTKIACSISSRGLPACCSMTGVGWLIHHHLGHWWATYSFMTVSFFIYYEIKRKISHCCSLRVKNQGVKLKLSLCFVFNWELGHEGVLVEWRYISIHSLASALGGDEWSASRQATSPPGKEPLVPIG